MKKVLMFLLPFVICKCFAQNIAINTTGATPDSSAIVDINSTNKGLLIPRLTVAQRNAISSPAQGLIIYNTDCNAIDFFTGAGWASLGGSNPATVMASAATGIADVSFSANWAAASGAVTYYLDVATDSAFNAFVTGYNNRNVGNVITYSVSGLSCNTAYYYRVRVSNNCATGSNSNIISATTTSCCGTTPATLSDVCTSTYSTYGYFFNIAALGNLTITQFALMTQNAGGRTTKVYYKSGTYSGSESNSAAWTLLGSANYSPSSGGSCPIPFVDLPVTFNVCISAGQTYGFYIVIDSGSGTYESDGSSSEGSVILSNSDMNVICGQKQGTNGAFGGSYTSGSGVQLKIYYNR